MTDTERFLAKTDGAASEAGCVEWTASRDKGYGLFYYAGQTRWAHRWAYENWVGPIPAGLEIDHLCGNTGCVNPFHLEAVTHAVNMSRTKSARKEWCVNGHRLTPENVYLKAASSTNGKRFCKVCCLARGAQRRQRAA